jgi:hypothetical protein
VELIKRRADVTIINESPKPYEDALMMKKLIIKLQHESRPYNTSSF